MRECPWPILMRCSEPFCKLKGFEILILIENVCRWLSNIIVSMWYMWTILGGELKYLFCKSTNNKIITTVNMAQMPGKLTTHIRFHTELFFYPALYSPHKAPEDVGDLWSISSGQLWCWISHWASRWHSTRQRSAVQAIAVTPPGHFTVSTPLCSLRAGNQPRIV